MIQSRMRSVLFVIMVALLSLGSVSAKKQPRQLQLVSILIVDRNGFTETVSSKDRLKRYQCVDFLKSQPYQKVLRIYERDNCGNAFSVITSYHENGNLRQYLEVVNARANGMYGEWHPNGNPSLMTTVIAGNADISSEAEKTWVFDNLSYAWNEKGDLIAEIQYSQGSLEGYSTYYHPSGRVWKQIPFQSGKINGEERVYLESGELFQQTTYAQGQKHGPSFRYWSNEQIASQEEYKQGKLESGQYFDSCGNMISEVSQGFGNRAVFGKQDLSELQEYKRGVLEGEVRVFGKGQRLVRMYHVKDGVSHGEEIYYYESQPDNLKPKLSVQWHRGKVQGIMKSWYPEGSIESQREMSNNAKTGLLTAWYRDGSIMMIEEYEKDKLVRGDYFKKGEKTPVSQVAEGKGIAIIYDSEGELINKITYERGKPQVE